MNQIVINLDETVVPKIEKSLLELVFIGGFKWPLGATCCTQERDGEIIWWNLPAMYVVEARNGASKSTGLLPHIGIKHLLHQSYYLINGQEVVADDWETAVITYEQYKEVLQ
ncbi:hypothetical protein [Vibrio cyclitrophicus]|uniref:hypothetical protein n=1 Tax=Vibrio cyclitrophicus TaxID=47951 RepID=UPI0032E3AF5A